MQDMIPGWRVTAHARRTFEAAPARAGPAARDCAAAAAVAEAPTTASAAAATTAVRITRGRAESADNKLLPSRAGPDDAQPRTGRGPRHRAAARVEHPPR